MLDQLPNARRISALAVRRRIPDTLRGDYRHDYLETMAAGERFFHAWRFYAARTTTQQLPAPGPRKARC